MDLNKNILLISYHYPPSSAIGGMRINGYAKYLSRLNWNVYILTVNEKFAGKLDFDRHEWDKKIEIHKTTILPKISITILNTIKKLTYKNSKAKIKSNTNKQFFIKESSKNKIKNIINSFLLLPDENRNWIIPALCRATKIIHQRNIEAIVTSCPPFSAHIIGLILKLFFGKKWIADYRDPWMNPFNKYLYPTSKVSVLIENYLEKIVIKKADIISSTTKKLNDKFVEIFDKELRVKFIYLSNGFDSEILDTILVNKKYDKFTITYTGTLYFGRSPEPVFKALTQLKKDGKIKKGEIKLLLVGNCNLIDGIRTKDILKNYNLTGEVEIRNAVSYKEAIKIIKKSHLGLVLAPNQPYQIPAKIYDMIGTETKLLTITEEGATKNIVEKFGIGGCFHWTDIDGIKNYIYKEFLNQGSKTIKWEKIKKRFNQKEITKELETHLKNLILYADNNIEYTKEKNELSAKRSA